MARILMFFVILLVQLDLVTAQDWPQWRGPERNGVVKDFASPETWPDSLKLVWRVPMAAGISSPIAVDGRIYLLTRTGDDEIVMCVDAGDGSEVWRTSYAAPFVPNPQAVRPRLFPDSGGKGPFATPLLHDGRLYTVGVDRTLSCFDSASGDVVWQHHFQQQELPEEIVYECPACGCSMDGKRFEEPGTCPDCGMAYSAMGLDTSVRQGGNYYGAVASPIAFKDVVVFHVGDGERSTMIAFDPQSGLERWRWNGQAISSSSPVLVEFAGVSQLITLTRMDVVGIAAETGEPLWSFPIESNAQIVTPTVFEDLVIFSTYRSPAIAIRIENTAEGWKTEEVWQSDAMSFFMSSPVLQGDKLFGLSYTQRGQFVCVDARTGEAIWSSAGRQATSAAMLNLPDAVVALKDDGELFVIEKGSDSFKVLARYTVAEHPVWAHPIIWEDKILVKDEAELSLWRIPSGTY